MSGNEDEHMLDAAIKYEIRSMSDQRPPDGFLNRVMDKLEPKRPTVWVRLKLWLTGPRSMTFSPIQAIPVVTCALALLALGLMNMNYSISDEAEPQLSTVRFVLSDKSMSAHTVSVIGSFNSWKAERSVMWYNDVEKTWILEATLPPGDHEYMFLVNGDKLVADPLAPMTRDDGFGNKNSIMFVNGSNEQSL